MKTLNTITLALLACAASASAVAQYNGYDASSSWTTGGKGYVLPTINAMDPDGKFGNVGNGTGIGLRVGKAVSPTLDIQAGMTFSRAQNGIARYRQNTLGVDGLYLFSRDRLRPFVLVGLGGEFDKLRTAAGQASDTSAYINAGLGFQYSFTPQWGMQLDFRRAHAFITGNDFAFRRANTNVLTVGLTYALDGWPAR